jgi:AcrR family transcriptional regulator
LVVAKGRPREFDIDKALDAALNVFWRKGYEGTTLPDLTAAMSINRPSLYAAFGNKESLFRKALDRYAKGPGCYVTEALNEPIARDVMENLFRRSVDLLTNPENPRGCLWVQGALACGESSESVRQELIARREASEIAIRKRFAKALAQDELPADISPADLARYVVAVMQGMSVLAAGGATRKELQRVAQIAMRIWPE